MALGTIRPQTAVVSVMIGGVEHNAVLDTVGVRSDAPEIVETVFSTENDGGECSVGTEKLTLNFGGPLKRGDVAAIPFIPLSAYQGKAFSIDFDEECTISGTCNFISGGPDSRAGGARRSAGTAMSTGTFDVSWNTTTGS